MRKWHTGQRGNGAFGRITGRGNSANLESVLALKPDLIVDSGSMRPTYVELAERVQAQTGIAYALLDGRFAAIPDSYERLGVLVGRESRARELAEACADAMRTVTARVAQVPLAERPRVYYARGPDGRPPPRAPSMATPTESTGSLVLARYSGELTTKARPTRAYFGQKDAQQALILKRMTADLNLPVEIVICPIVREPDGLALSSRNAYLTPEEREVAPVLRRALLHGAELIGEGQRSADHVRGEMAAVVEAAPLGTLDYVEVADPRSLLPVTNCDGPVRLFGAVQFGRARLIDNLAAEPPAHG